MQISPQAEPQPEQDYSGPTYTEPTYTEPYSGAQDAPVGAPQGTGHAPGADASNTPSTSTDEPSLEGEANGDAPVEGPIMTPSGDLRVGVLEVSREQIPEVVPTEAIDKASRWAAYGEWQISQVNKGVSPEQADRQAATAMTGAAIGAVAVGAAAGIPAAAAGCVVGAGVGAIGGAIAGEVTFPAGGGLPGAGIGAAAGCGVGGAVAGGAAALGAGTLGAAAGAGIGYALGAGDPSAPQPEAPPPLVELPPVPAVALPPLPPAPMLPVVPAPLPVPAEVVPAPVDVAPPPAPVEVPPLPVEVQAVVDQVDQGWQDFTAQVGQAAVDAGVVPPPPQESEPAPAASPPPAHIAVPGLPPINVGGVVIGG